MQRKQIISGIVFVTLLLVILHMLTRFFVHGTQHAVSGQTGKVNMIMQHGVDPQILIAGT